MNTFLPRVTGFRTLHTTSVVLLGIGAVFVDLGISMGPAAAVSGLVGFSFLAANAAVRSWFATNLLNSGNDGTTNLKARDGKVSRAEIAEILKTTMVSAGRGAMFQSVRGNNTQIKNMGISTGAMNNV